MNKIYNSDLFAAIHNYTISGNICGLISEGFTKTEFFDPVKCTHVYYDNGVEINYENKIETIGFSASLFSGVDHPFSYWTEVTITGIDSFNNVQSISENLKKLNINHTLQIQIQNNKFNLHLNDERYKYFITPAPYLNGVQFSVGNLGNFKK